MSPVEQYEPPKKEPLSEQQEKLFRTLAAHNYSLLLAGISMGFGTGILAANIFESFPKFPYQDSTSLAIGLDIYGIYFIYKILGSASKINHIVARDIHPSKELSDLLENKNK